MKKRLSFLCLALLTIASFLTSQVWAQNLDANGSLPRATPEETGISSEALLDAIQTLDSKVDRVDGFMILNGGKVIAEAWRAPCGPDVPHPLYSLSKSFASTAIGFAVDEGLMTLDQKIIDSFTDELPADPDPRLKDVTLEHLLTMTCGHAEDFDPPGLVVSEYGLPRRAPVSPTWMQDWLARKIVHTPGTTFVYNTGGMYVAAGMLQKITGQTMRDYLEPRLFEPLHIENAFWEESAEGISKGGTGLVLKLEDVAKFGQFYLQRGVWNGKQLLSAEWVDKASSNHLSKDPNGGYGYQFWRAYRYDYYGMGSLGQFSIIMPEYDMVVAIESDCADLGSMINVILNMVMPKLKAAKNQEALPENAEALAKLRDYESNLPAKKGTSGSVVFAETVHSEALHRDVNYQVYVPTGYKASSISYPTLYLLHGMGGNERQWTDENSGNMKAICDAYFAEHLTERRIVIMPDAASLWYRDSADDSCKYETFFFNELIPDVQRKYRCQTSRESRAIAGISMGGYGSLLYALHRPDMFSACYVMSAAIRTQEEVATHSFDEFLTRYKSRDDMKETDERFDDYYFANDPHRLVASMAQEQKGMVRFLLDCGDDDYLLPGNFAFFDEARKNGVPCELRIRDGGHTFDYWRSALPMALEFFAK